MTTKRAKKAAPRAKTQKTSAKKAAAKKRAKKAPAKKKASTKTGKTVAPSKKVVKRVTVARKKTRKRAATGTGADQRVHERHDLPEMPVVGVELLGYQRDGREFGIGPKPDPGRKFQTTGITSNLSLSGMLARVGDNVSEGSHCLVRFLNGGNAILPDLRWGLIIRANDLESGECEVAVSFDSPLEVLDLDALAA